jgi:hypothetical protein
VVAAVPVATVVTAMEARAAMVMAAKAATVMAARAATAMEANRAAERSHKIRSRSKPGLALIPRPSCSPRSSFSFGPRPIIRPRTRLNPWYKRPMPTDRMTTKSVHKIN